MKPRNMLTFESDEGAGGGTATEPAPTSDRGGERGTLMADLLKEREKRKAAEKRATDAEQKLTEAEQAKLSENEQLKARVAALETENTDLKAEKSKTEKATLVRGAAKNFHDPEDAVALLETRGLLTDIEDASDAERAVKALATDRPHLVKDGTEAATGASLQQILEHGLGVEVDKGKKPPEGETPDDGKNWTLAEMRAMSSEEMAEAQANQPKKLERSIKALGV